MPNGECEKCRTRTQPDYCTRLNCPRQSVANQWIVEQRWKRTLALAEQLRSPQPPATLGTMREEFERKGWAVR